MEFFIIKYFYGLNFFDLVCFLVYCLVQKYQGDLGRCVFEKMEGTDFRIREMDFRIFNVGYYVLKYIGIDRVKIKYLQDVG